MRCRTTKFVLLPILLHAGLAVLTAPALAVTTDEIEAGLQDWVANTLLQSAAGADARLDGQVSVSADGSGFLAMLPPIRLVVGPQDRTEILIDPIAVTLQPLVSGGYAANWTLPDTITILGHDGAMATVTIGGQSGHGLYAPEFGLMVSSDLELRDIRVAAPGRPPHLAVDSLLFSTRYDSAAAGLFNQSTEIQIAGLTGLRADGTEAVRIAAIGLSGGAQGVHLAAWRDLRNSLRAPFAHRAKTSAGLSERIGMAAEAPPAPLTSFQGRHRISGARFDLGGGGLSIGDGTFDVSMDGLDSGFSSMSVAFRVSDMDLPDAIGPLMPREMAVDLVLSGLPTDRLFDALAAMIAGVGLAESGHALAMFTLHLQDAMMTSGARIEVQEILLVADDARLRIAGTIKPSHLAPLGVIADLDMSIGGIDALLAAARSGHAARDTLRQLALLRAVGTPGTDPDGTPTLRFGLEINQQGQMLLNGADLRPALATAAP